MENGQEIVGCWHEIVIFRKYSFRWPRLGDELWRKMTRKEKKIKIFISFTRDHVISVSVAFKLVMALIISHSYNFISILNNYGVQVYLS